MTTPAAATRLRSAGSGPVGILLVTGSPAALRPAALGLAEQGFRVELALLPGYGTRWRFVRESAP